MTDNQTAAHNFWNLPQKGLEEKNRERNFIDDIIQKAHIEKLVLSDIDSIETVFDGGAGTGRFSLLLAGLGKKVTHFDISQSMITAAKEKAMKLQIDANIEFICDDLNNLQKYRENKYDLVLSIDAPVSYCYPNHMAVIANLARITKKRLILSVSSKFGSLNYALNPFHKSQYMLEGGSPVEIHRKLKSIDSDKLRRSLEGIKEILQSSKIGSEKDIAIALGKNRSPWPITYLFTAEEIESMLAENGISHMEFSGPGAFSRSIPNELLRKLVGDPELKDQFLQICFEIDSQKSVAGLGKDNLTVVGRKIGNQ